MIYLVIKIHSKKNSILAVIIYNMSGAINVIIKYVWYDNYNIWARRMC